LPPGAGGGTAFSPDDKYLSVAHSFSPFITIYEIDSATNTFTKLANPASLPTGNGLGTAFSPDDKYLSVAHATSPFITIYEIDSATNTFTKLANPSNLPGGNGRGTAFSPDSKYMSVAHISSPYMIIYGSPSTGPGNALALQNQPAVVEANASARLRLLLNVDDKDAASSVLKLQYAPRVGSVCSTNFTGYSYADVPPSLGSGFVTYFDDPNAVQGMAFDGSVDDPSNARTSVLQSYVEQNTFSVSNLTPSGQTAMWDFAIEDTSSLGGSYCFRVVMSDGTPLNTYSFIPELGSPPRTPQFMRHGRWFDTAGQARPFYWGR
jgi:DNA-binding beta-propeller fold protein YncE